MKVGENRVRNSPEPRGRRRWLAATTAAVLVVACLGFGAYAITQWWPQQAPILVITDGILGAGPAGETTESAVNVMDSPGVAFHWPGDGSTDEAAGTNPAVLCGDATYAEGLFGQAFYLDGDGDYVEVADDPALNPGTGDFTASCWVKYDSFEHEQVIMEKYVEYDPRYGWTLTRMPDNRVRAHLAPDNLIESEPQDIPNNVWVFYAVRRAAGLCTVFFNGLPVASGPAPADLSTTASFKLGHRGNPEDTPGSVDDRQFYLHGAIDDVHYWVGSALTDEEIHSLYEEAPG